MNASPSKQKVNSIKSCTSMICTIVFLGIFIWAGLSVANVTLTQALLDANIKSIATKGRGIYQAIKTENSRRQRSGLLAVFARTCNTNDYQASDMRTSDMFYTSTDYFNWLMDGKRFGTEQWTPIVHGLNTAQFSGGGVPTSTNNQLSAACNMWAIAANVTEDDDARIPLLISRNVNVKVIEHVVNHGLTVTNFADHFSFSHYCAPFGSKFYAFIRKDGSVYRPYNLSINRMFKDEKWPRYARNNTLGTLFGNQELPPRDPSKPPIVYLMP
jgi:hypothetical protein